jgi:hypothetical protein
MNTPVNPDAALPPLQTYENAVTYYTLCGVFNLLFIFDLIVFLYFARTEQALQSRGRFLTCTHVIGSILLCTNAFVSQPSHSAYSCSAYYWLAAIGFTLWTTSLCLKFWRLVWLYELNRKRIEVEKSKDARIRRDSLQYSTLQRPGLLPHTSNAPPSTSTVPTTSSIKGKQPLHFQATPCPAEPGHDSRMHQSSELAP